MTEHITRALKKIETGETIRQGNFYFEKKFSLSQMPLEISVQGYGKLLLPLQLEEIEKLCKFAVPAKFGVRDLTLFDKNVRDTAEIPGSHVTVRAGKKKDAFDPLLHKIGEGLGLTDNCKLIAKLHNLLIYSKGQFFAPHRDTEKEEGMVASLVIVLPAPHLGGALTVEHQGEKKIFSYANITSNKVNCVAFYADCTHEVKPVTDGYRVALTYNLILKPVENTAPVPSLELPELKEELTRYFAAPAPTRNNRSNKHPPRLCYLLDHSYTQHSLKWTLLKGNDRLRAHVLKTLAEELGCEIYLTLAEIRETWTEEGGYDDYRYSRRAPSNPKPDELIDSEIELSHWVATDNQLVADRKMSIGQDNLCWTTANNQLKPFDQGYEGWMGNYGNTIDYWYQRAAVVMWRTEDHLAFQFETNAKEVLDSLYKLTGQKNCEPLLQEKWERIVPYWQEYKVRTFYTREWCKHLFTVALAVGDAAIARVMLQYGTLKLLSPDNVPLLQRLFEQYGEAWSRDLLALWQKEASSREECADLLPLAEALKKSGMPHYCTDFVIDHAFVVIKRIDIKKQNEGEVTRGKQNLERVKRITTFLKAAYHLGKEDRYAKAVQHIINDTLLYPPLELVGLVGEMETLPDNTALGFPALQSHVRGAIERELAAGIRHPADWSLPVVSKCKCEACPILNAFLSSPTEQEKIWPLRQDGRTHVTTVLLQQLEAPVDIYTQEKGAPYKLVLTKRNSIHEDAKKRFERVSAAYAHMTQKETV